MEPYTADTEFAGTTKAFDGSFLVYRRLPSGYGKNLSLKTGGTRLPFFRHDSFAAAEKEAMRLCAKFPESTFIIMRQVATVKVRVEETAEQVSA